MSGREIHFHAPGLKRFETSEFTQQRPSLFVPVSLTGQRCALQCAHCEGRLLAGMRTATEPGQLLALCEALAANGTRGVLVTGGSNEDGSVPLLPVAEELREVKRRTPLKVLVHTGFPDEPTAKALGAAGIDGAMMDVIGDSETLRKVYHLDMGVGDVEAALKRLNAYGIPAVPHILLGLHFGQLRGEHHALELCAQTDLRALVLVVIMPLAGTAMQGVTPPPTSEVAAFFTKARQAVPSKPVLLGCARPMGPQKLELDRAAIDAGLDGIAYPAEGAVSYAVSRGLTPRFHETCCSVILT